MCGFLFEYSQSVLTEKDKFYSGLNALSHRGPDSKGVWENRNIRMGHTRLSIIDLNKRGDQPFKYKNLNLIYNGEIFNYKEIKAELKKLGYSFLTKSDTEVVLLAYHKWGQKCVEKFNGMWAFVIYDDINQEIFASRDRFGIKPFFIFEYKNGYIFSSEIEPLTKFGLKLTIDAQYIAQFVRQGDPFFCGSTFFNEIKELLPANNLFLKKGKKLNTNRYWNYPNKNTIKTNNESFKEFEKLLTDSITLRLRSDVDMALLLSGGLDSSLVAEDINANNPGCIKRAYCYSSQDYFDEVDFAKRIAARSGMNFQKIEHNNIERNYIKKLKILVRRFGKGLASRSVVPVSFIYERISKDGIKVAIDGQGADELLAGYKNYHLVLLPFYLKNFKFKHALDLIKDIFENGFIKTMMLGYRVIMPEFMKYIGRVLIGYEKYLIKYKRDFLNKNILLNFKKQDKAHEDPFNNYLINHHKNGLIYLIYYGDIISMLYSVENRSPFLDHRLVEFAFSTDSFFKVQGALNKVALRKNKFYDPIKKILERKKIGFSTYISKNLKNQMIKELKNSPIHSLGIFSKYLKRDLISKKFMKKKYEYLLFRIYQIHLWFQIYKDSLCTNI
tara:strand:+ start:7106 stop:8944 length:1839 start_codon:yes stop_codon:yes gene_type:complete